jgi:myo-inositol-1(or 4)-monophosphatase
VPEEQITPEIDAIFLQACLREAGALALSQYGKVSASLKPDLTPVTQVDRQVEKLLVERIAAGYPAHRILSEESGTVSDGKEFTWVIDPIDGTRAFASGLPIWGVSIGVLRGIEPYVGGFYLPATNEMFWGTRQEAYYNEKRLAPLTAPALDDPLVFLAVPSDFHMTFQVTFPRVRSMGSTAAHLAYTATGAAIGALIHPFSLWDLAGILPMLLAVGVRITYLSGRMFQAAELLDGRKSSEPILAAHPQIAEEIRSSIFQVKE